MSSRNMHVKERHAINFRACAYMSVAITCYVRFNIEHKQSRPGLVELPEVRSYGCASDEVHVQVDTSTARAGRPCHQPVRRRNAGLETPDDRSVASCVDELRLVTYCRQNPRMEIGLRVSRLPSLCRDVLYGAVHSRSRKSRTTIHHRDN